MTAPCDPPAVRGHVVVVGATSTAVRLVDELDRAGEPVVVLAVGADSGTLEDLAAGEAVVRGCAHVRESELRWAGVERASAVVVLGLDDVTTTRIALAVEEIGPDVRQVLELANPSFSSRLTTLIGECVVLSSAQLAAPGFVAAAVSDGDVQTFELADRIVTAGPRGLVSGPTLAILGDSAEHGLPSLLPDDGDIVLATGAVPQRRRGVRTSGLPGAVASVFDRRLRWVLLGLLGLMLVSVVYFHVVGRQGWWLSFYLALTAATQTGIGDTDLPLPARFGGVFIQLMGLVLSSGITAVIVDALIKSRIGELTGGVRGRPRHHTVVCGLGRIGSSVVTRLHALGIPVVAIERDQDAPGVLRARRLRVPVIIAEATDPDALEQAGLSRADAILAITDNDAANLEIGLVAKNARPGVRVVTRLFDHDLAARVERRLDLGPTRSVSMVAAPAFAAAALGRRAAVVHPVGRRVLVFTELPVRAGSPAAGVVPEALGSAGQVRVLAVRRGEGAWSWCGADQSAGNGPPLVPGDRLAVVATRTGLARLLQTVTGPQPPRQSSPESSASA